MKSKKDNSVEEEFYRKVAMREDGERR